MYVWMYVQGTKTELIFYPAANFISFLQHKQIQKAYLASLGEFSKKNDVHR
jgi:hypothetical protein